MERPSSQVYTTSGNQTPIPFDRYVNGLSIAAYSKAQGAIYTVQYTLDDVEIDPIATFNNGGNPVKWSVGIGTSATWFNWPNQIMIAASTDRSDIQAFAPTAIRLSISAKVSAGNPLVFNIVPFGMDAN
jgi:hypothetical protein